MVFRTLGEERVHGRVRVWLDWQLELQVPETGRKPVPPSLERGDGGRPVCYQPSPILPTSRKGGSWQEEVGRDPGTWISQGEEFALGLCPLF